jgi:hypothetical protein
MTLALNILASIWDDFSANNFSGNFGAFLAVILGAFSGTSHPLGLWTDFHSLFYSSVNTD